MSTIPRADSSGFCMHARRVASRNRAARVPGIVLAGGLALLALGLADVSWFQANGIGVR